MEQTQPRKGAAMAQWAIYLALSTLLGLAWAVLGFMALMALGGADLVGTLPFLVPFFVASFFVAIAYRLFAFCQGHAPSHWFAVAIPAFGAAAYQAFITYETYGSLPFSRYMDALLPTLMATYVCGGIVLIPLAIPHAIALRWLHQKQEAWATHASRRAIRQTAYGVACFGLLVFSEGRGLYLRHQEHRVKMAVAGFGVSMPKGTVLLGQNDVQDDDDVYAHTANAYFRVDGGMTWPPREGATPLMQEENHREVRGRLMPYTNGEITRDSKMDQVKWYDEGGWVQASRLRTSGADYVELIRKP